MSAPDRPVPPAWSAALSRLMQVVDTLRGPEGCPWDQQQSVASLAPHLIEESHEVADAVARNHPEHLCEELGDLLMGVLMVARVAEEELGFGPAEVALGVVDKLIRRHPHVYGSAEQRAAGEVPGQWERIKAAERAARGESAATLGGVPAALPALLRAHRIGTKAAAVGFDWPDADGPAAKVREELIEVEQAVAAGDPAQVQDEIGDLLFAVVNWARKLEVEPELALRGTLHRFQARFDHLEQALARAGRRIEDTDPTELNSMWEQAKAEVRLGKKPPTHS